MCLLERFCDLDCRRPEPATRHKERIHDPELFVSQCLNANISSFGESQEEALHNLTEAVELYLDDEMGRENFRSIGQTVVGEMA